MIFGDFLDLLSPFTTQYLTFWSPKCFVVVSIDLSERNWCEMICHILYLFLGFRNPRCWSFFRFAWRIFAVFRVYFAIFIYGNDRNVYFQNPLIILHLLICNNLILWHVVWKLVYPVWKMVCNVKKWPIKKQAQRRAAAGRSRHKSHGVIQY